MPVDLKNKKKEESETKRQKGWKDIPIGGLIDKGGTAKAYKTGDWRTFRPVRDEAKCINCMICWAYCPDSAIKTKDGKMTGFDLDYCKGCGICASVCPVKCIKMVQEERK
ncbi:MAG: 4Fe-4S binding protein [Candidatus Omnitrophica bacterium]|nr:4Fe-4S binding protein [Candidatus Omnitrophota bacterium]MBU4488795.1 4Fe-4S binding protein [Candidatus Omnitrophota bacterium]MCG2705452.1 4Fe-4S binding protein [Candidatus Omnitrophota bacterium]